MNYIKKILLIILAVPVILIFGVFYGIEVVSHNIVVFIKRLARFVSKTKAWTFKITERNKKEDENL